jgi:hemerythrin-like domain-containing protein
MDNFITESMAIEHERLQKILKEFEKETEGNLKNSLEKLYQFKWGLEKHFLVEEKGILELYGKIFGENVEEIFRIMKEHGELLDILKKIEGDLRENQKPDLSQLKLLLQKHEEFEDEVFYPKLDEFLEPQQKLEMKKRILEIVRG